VYHYYSAILGPAGRLYNAGVLQTGLVTYSFNGTDHVTDHVVRLQARHMSVSDVTDVVTLHRTRE